MPSDDFVPQLHVTLNGSNLHADEYDGLTEVRAESSLQLPDQVRLRFDDPDFELYDRQVFEIGDDVGVAIGFEGSPEKVAECEVTSIGVAPGHSGQMSMYVTALGRDHVLHRGITLDTYTDQTDSEIVEKLAVAAGLKVDIDATTTRHPHVTQATTDYEFISERAALVGYRWWVTGKTLYFKKAPPNAPAATAAWGEDIIDLRVETASASASTGAEVRGWDPDNQSAVVGTASSSPELATIGTDARGPTSGAKSARKFSTKQRFEANIVTDDVESANALASGMVLRAAAEEVHVRGEVVGDPKLRAGVLLQIEKAGVRLSGKYRLASVEHVYSARSGYSTKFSSGGQDARGLADLVGHRRDTRARWDTNALVIGVVTNIEDPDQPSRVKVSFPTFDDSAESAWARLALPGAGADRGLQLLPEVGDEVLVGFEHGNAHRPIVLGGLWSKKNAPPLSNADAVKSGSVAVRTLKSRAGHSITINDADAEGGNSIVVQLADGKGTFRLGQDEVRLETPVDISMTTEKTLSLVAAGDVSISGANVKITADSKIDLEATDVGAKGASSASIEGGTVDIKGSAKVGVDGGGLTEIKGGLVKLN
ncbi:MAG: VgrG-related protein [Ilumatobacter sp.]